MSKISVCYTLHFAPNAPTPGQSRNTADIQSQSFIFPSILYFCLRRGQVFLPLTTRCFKRRAVSIHVQIILVSMKNKTTKHADDET